MDNPAKLSAQVTLDEEEEKKTIKQTIKTNNTICVGHQYAHTNTIQYVVVSSWIFVSRDLHVLINTSHL